MEFSGISFLFYFLPAFLILYFVSSVKHRNLVLLVGSLVFYAWGEPLFFIILLLSALFNYLAGKRILNCESEKKKKIILTVSVLINILVVVLLKGLDHLIADKTFVLKTFVPIGIHIYTLHAISFVVETYRGKISKTLKFVNFAAYLCMFPSILAGPVIKYTQIEKQLNTRRSSIEGFSMGIIRFVVGLSKKVLLADNLFILWNSVKCVNPIELSVMSSWLGIISFAMGVYYFISGYSDMALGLLKMIGFELPDNFNYPILSTSVSDFVKRWNISLTTWFYDYIYTPIYKQNKKGVLFVIAVILCCISAGLWYGTGLNYIAFGVYFAFLIILEKSFTMKGLIKIPKLFKMIYASFFVLSGWVFFANDSICEAILYFKAMFGFGGGFISGTFLYDITSNIVLLAVSVLSLFPFWTRCARKYMSKTMSYVIVPVSIALILSISYIVA